MRWIPMVGLVIMALICVGVPFAGSAIAVFFVVGLVAIWFGPETRGQLLRDRSVV